MENNLINDISSGMIVPQNAFDGIAWASNNKLNIESSSLEGYSSAVLFFWNYQTEKPIFIREVQVKNSHITIDANPTLLMQIKYLNFDSVRVAIAIPTANGWNCGYVRNNCVKAENITARERAICKLKEKSKETFCAYWTEGGFLSLKFRNTAEFDKELYSMILVGYMIRDTKFIGFLEAPAFEGKMDIELRSMTTGKANKNVKIDCTETSFTGLRRVFRVEIDLESFDEKTADAFKIVGIIDGHVFRTFGTKETIEDKVISIDSLSDSTMDILPCIENDGQFNLQIAPKIYPYMLSVVTAVYNTAPFLAEMINSVLLQDTGKLKGFIIGNSCRDYSKRIYQDIFEFILVDDGSTDGSGQILDDYAHISECIKVIHKKNGGVSSARNAGMDVSCGKYITFPDSDDVLGENYFNGCLSFFEAYENEISMVCVPMKMFGATTGDHWANYKFDKNNKIINLYNEPDAVVYAANSTFVKNFELRGKRFNTTLRRGEDNVFINDILLEQIKQIGAIGKTCYWYRKRKEGQASAMQSSMSWEDSYTYIVENVQERFVYNSIEKYGCVPKYVQYSVMGQLQWRFASIDKGEKAKSVLGIEEFYRYKNKLIELLKYIDDDVILKQKKLYSEHYYYLFKQKYHIEPQAKFENDDIIFYFGEKKIPTGIGQCYIKIDIINIEHDTLHVEGISMNYTKEITLGIYFDGEPIEFEIINRDVHKYSLDDVVFYATPFIFEVQLNGIKSVQTIEFSGKFSGFEAKKKIIRFSKLAPLNEKYQNSYYQKNGWVIKKQKGALVIYDTTAMDSENIDFETLYINELLNSKIKTEISDVIRLRRMALNLMSRMGNKQIWLVGDRADAARDSGEAMFRFLCKINNPNIETYFVIDKNCLDYQRIKKIGKTVERGSEKHLLLRLMANCIVSSAADDIVLNPWIKNPKQTGVIKDLLAKTYLIYLKHGIINHDMSSWLNKYNKNFSGIVCASWKEADSIRQYNYFYDEKNIWLTGLPRHDRLYNDEKRYITIMPTWRKWLAEDPTGANRPGEKFIESSYFKFYNSLINNSRLLEFADLYSYKICFMPHPSVQRVIERFDYNEKVIFFANEKQYNEIFAESSLLVTDYSSVTFEFAMLKKPIVYCQFDAEEFYANHTYTRGYFDFTRDGFGEVTHDQSELVETIISYMKEECKVHEPYISRMDSFFAFHDKENCNCVYNNILKLNS